MTHYIDFKKLTPEKTITKPRVVRELTIGTVISYNIPYGKGGSGIVSNNLIVIRKNGTVGIIKLDFPASYFTEMSDTSLYYSCWNTQGGTSQIRSKNSLGAEQPIINLKNNCLGLGTTNEGICVVLEKTYLDVGVLSYINENKNKTIIKSNFISPSGMNILPNGEIIVSDKWGIYLINKDNTSTKIIQNNSSMFAGYFNNLCVIKDRFLFNSFCLNPNAKNKNRFRVYNYKTKTEEKTAMEYDNFGDLGFGNYIWGFHIDSNGSILIWNGKGVFRLNLNFHPAEFAYKPENSYLWNPKIVKIKHTSQKDYQYAKTFMLCINKLSNENEEIPEVPPEMLHIILSHTHIWEFPNKKLNWL